MFSTPDIDAALARGAVLLTPNQRSARAWNIAFDSARRAQGATAWQPAHVYPWRAWTTELWERVLIHGLDDRVLLNSMQETALWERVYRTGMQQSLRSSRTIAALCSEAMWLLGGYDTRGEYARSRKTASTTDTAAYRGWHLRFTQICESERYLPLAELDMALSRHLGSLGDLPEEILLHGLQDLAPAQQVLLQALQDAGVRVTSTPAPPKPLTAELVRCADAADEFARCSAWTRSKLESNPEARIMIVVPDLDACRPRLERALRQALVPEQQYLLAPERALPYDFSSGVPLSSVALAADALRLLRWADGALPLQDVSALFTSPYVPLAPSPEEGAEADAFGLRRKSIPLAAVRMDELAGLLHKHHPAIAESLRALHRACRSAVKGMHTFAEWSDIARDLLASARWLQARERNSFEFQAAERWEDLLDQISTLDMILRRVDWTTFLDTLVHGANETTFAPENTGAPVQVVSPSEARGSRADALWFLHADEPTWTARRSTHPFLPRSLQIRCGMPGSDEQLDENAAVAEAYRIWTSASDVCFSYAATSSDGVQRPSPLLNALPHLDAPRAHNTTMEIAQPFHAEAENPALEEVEDDLPLPALAGSAAVGGSSVLKLQAACPFRAFAEHRLFSSAPGEIDLGLSQQDRGIFIHGALQRFWERVRTQEELRNLSSTHSGGLSRRDEILAECVDETLPKAAPASWEAAYLHIQRERMLRLLGKWLDFEQARPPFVVEEIEQEREGRIGPLTLKLRIDRIDRVGVGDTDGVLLVDYKTGAHNVNGWDGDRPDEPQLPLYAVAGGQPDVCGIAFAALSTGKKGLVLSGVASDPEIIGGKHHDFAERLPEWQEVLVNLAEAFASGNAIVDPKNYPASCEHCGQRLLCRVDPSRMRQEEMEEEEFRA